MLGILYALSLQNNVSLITKRKRKKIKHLFIMLLKSVDHIHLSCVVSLTFSKKKSQKLKEKKKIHVFDIR